MELLNRTPFVLDQMVALDKHAAEHLVVMLKATINISEAGVLTRAEKQLPLQAADIFYDDPAMSSIHHESEMSPPKPATDVILIGSALAPRTGTRIVDVSLRAGTLSKRARVFGKRIWRDRTGAMTEPEPFDAIPLIYENAFGGTDLSAEEAKHHNHEPRNPVGRGFRSEKSRLPIENTELPNIEDPQNPIRSPSQGTVPQGFGAIARNWLPRASYAGTYDQQWLDERIPLLPLDFDERFHNAAHPDLVASGYFRGGEPIEIIGCTRQGRLAFSLPLIEPRAAVRLSNRSEGLALTLNTVTIDTHAMQLRLLWKGQCRIHRELLKLRQVECRAAGWT